MIVENNPIKPIAFVRMQWKKDANDELHDSGEIPIPLGLNAGIQEYV